MEFTSVLLLIVATLFAFIIVQVPWWQGKPKNVIKVLPPQPRGSFPIIGHLFLLRGQTPVFKTLGILADRHGPVFKIWLGMQPALVVSSWEAAKECFRTNDQVFLTRPSSASSKYMGYNNSLFGLCPYGPYWREVRKIATQELLSNSRLELLKHVRITEVETSIKELYTMCIHGSGSAIVDVSQWFEYVSMNVIVQMIAGKRYCGGVMGGTDRELERFGRVTKEFFYLCGVQVASDVIPCVEWLDLQGHIRSMKRVAGELDTFMSSWLQEHIQCRKEGKVKEERDFIDIMLSSLGDDDATIHGIEKQVVIKATAMNLMLAGTDTTSDTMTWAVSLLMNHKEVLRKVQEELETHVGKERRVEDSDMKKLVYLQAVVKETLRLYPPGPLLVPREAMEDCCVLGYHVRKGTRLLVNAWKLHRDPRVWENPCDFRPERFLTSHAGIDVGGQHLGYIPFGSGRRLCPGISFSLQVIYLTLATLLQGFDLSTLGSEAVDMCEGLGLTMPKATPLELKVTPRLGNALYGL